MTDGIEITGGAGEFEAAVIAVVLDHIAEEERAAREGRTKADSGLPAWVRALHSDEDESPVRAAHLAGAAPPQLGQFR